jgi:hypothetical protein
VLEASKVAHEGEEAAKSQQKERHVGLRAEKNTIKMQWKEMVLVHNVAVTLWQIEKECQVRAEILKKNLPRKPKCPTKLKLLAAAMSSGGVDNESGDDEVLGDEDSL